jgi:uncharacterized protein YjdB
MKLYHSFCAATLFAALFAGSGCGGTSNVVDDGKAVSELQVTPETTTLTRGSTIQFHAVVNYGDGTSKDVTESDETVWNTSNPRVATVTDEGMVTAVSEGLVEISANYKGEKATEQFAVTP